MIPTCGKSFKQKQCQCYNNNTQTDHTPKRVKNKLKQHVCLNMQYLLIVEQCWRQHAIINGKANNHCSACSVLFFEQSVNIHVIFFHSLSMPQPQPQPQTQSRQSLESEGEGLQRLCITPRRF
jgi:hypothetical protein